MKGEMALQASVAYYLDLRSVLWFHPANERKTKIKYNKRGNPYSPEGTILKRLGVKKGIPDVMIMQPNKYHPGMAIELKWGKNKVTKEQQWWLEALHDIGWLTIVGRDFDTVKKWIDLYLDDAI